MIRVCTEMMIVKQLASEMSAFVGSGVHQTQREQQPNAISTFVEALARCSPPVPLRPFFSKVRSTPASTDSMTCSVSSVNVNVNSARISFAHTFGHVHCALLSSTWPRRTTCGRAPRSTSSSSSSTRTSARSSTRSPTASRSHRRTLSPASTCTACRRRTRPTRFLFALLSSPS